jgi:hypothetical protein
MKLKERECEVVITQPYEDVKKMYAPEAQDQEGRERGSE